MPVDFVLLDTEAAVSLIHEDVWSQISKLEDAQISQLQEWKGKRLVGVNGSALSVKGFGKFLVFLGDRKTPTQVTLIVTSDLTVHEAILGLGLDFVDKHKCLIDCNMKTLTFPDDSSSLLGETIGLVTMEKVVVPPSSEVELMVKQICASGGTWLVESEASSHLGVMAARRLVCPDKMGWFLWGYLILVMSRLVLKKGVKLAKMESIEENCTLRVSAIGMKPKMSQKDQSTIWNMMLESGNCTSDIEKEHLYSLFTEYSDVLSPSSSGLGRTSVMKHLINTGDAQPVHRLPRRIP